MNSEKLKLEIKDIERQIRETGCHNRKKALRQTLKELKEQLKNDNKY